MLKDIRFVTGTLGQAIRSGAARDEKRVTLFHDSAII
jgi:hypothetical protein